MNTVLIVEDEKMIRQGIKTMIERSGVPVNTIIECNNGQSALEILKNQKVDVMFTDIRMPKMDGIELVKSIQGLPHTPFIVAISGYDDFSYAVEMLKGGVREYILKPVEREKIKEILENLEKEILQMQNEEEELKLIGRQQLKYVMTGDVTKKEMQRVADWFTDILISKDYYVICTQLQDGWEESSGEYELIYWKDIEKNSVYIIKSSDKDKFLAQELHGSFSGISQRYHGIEYLKTAYLEAKEARKEAFCILKNEIYYNDILWKEQKSSPAERINQIAQQVGTNRISESIASIKQMVKDTKSKKISAADFEEEIVTLIQAIINIYENVMQQTEEEASRFKEVYSFSDIDSFTEEFTGWLLLFHDRLGEEFDDYKNKYKIQEAISYIYQNYNKDLNMAVVSNHVSMNYSLFSYVFKQYTGKNFVNYLKEIRVEQAQRLLVDTDMRVIEISRKVGYDNEKSFMKIFRSLCGVSPTEYRKNMLLKHT